MRHVFVLAILGFPAIALAQTAQDVARLAWPQGAPAYSGEAPRTESAVAGAGTGYDLARLLSRQDSGVLVTSRLAAPPITATTFAGDDLARLRGNAQTAAWRGQVSETLRVAAAMPAR